MELHSVLPGKPLRRVAFFFRRIAAPGGAERTMYEEALRCSQLGIDAPIFTFSLSPGALFDPPYEVRVEELGTIRSSLSRALFGEWRNILALRRRLVELKPDIVVGSSAVDCMDLYLATLGTGIPYASHVHGTIFWFDRRFVTSWLKYAWVHRHVFAQIRNSVVGHREFYAATPPDELTFPKRIMAEILARAMARSVRSASVLFTLSRHMAWEIECLYGRKAIVVKGGVSATLRDHRQSIDVRSRLGLQGRRMILNVNRLDPRKRVDVAVRAFALIADRYPDTVLVVGGTGPEESALQALVVELALESRVKFVGYIADNELADYLGACEVFVHPNWADFAISPYEALALKRKVVWSTEMEVDETIAQSGQLFPADPTPLAIADALTRALESRGRPIADLTQYTWPVYADHVLRSIAGELGLRVGEREVSDDGVVSDRGGVSPSDTSGKTYV